VPKLIRAACALLFFVFALPVAAQAATRMPIGFYDDASFRWSDARLTNLAAAAAAGATIIHTNANWATIAPTRPADPTNGDDPAYKLADLDQLVAAAPQYGIRVMVTIVGTPKWANGGQTPNHMPRRLSDLTTFARMLATRYNGLNGHGTVSIWSVWNEPNLQLFLTPQFVGKKIVSPANYAKLYTAAYTGIKAGNPAAQVAIGETSPEGRDKPIGKQGQGQSVAPATFAKLLATHKGLKFAAWAEHPYPTAINGKALEKVRYPNVTLTQLPQFEKDLSRWFHKSSVPLWLTEYGHQTRPEEAKGVTYAQQATYAREAMTYARNDKNVQMFIWFTFRDSASNPWHSGIEKSSGAPKPSFSVFSSLAHALQGTTQSVRAGETPTVTMYVPTLAYYSPPGSVVGITYTVTDRGKMVASGEPTAPLSASQSISFAPSFTPVKGHTYTVSAVVNEANGHTETVLATLQS